jgi:hypothetical protein
MKWTFWSRSFEDLELHGKIMYLCFEFSLCLNRPCNLASYLIDWLSSSLVDRTTSKTPSEQQNCNVPYQSCLQYLHAVIYITANVKLSRIQNVLTWWMTLTFYAFVGFSHGLRSVSPKSSNRVQFLSHHLNMETDSVSETVSFLVT